jgi:hypothetical protein
MSIEQLQEDVRNVAQRLPSGPLTSAADLADYMRSDLLPLLVTMTEEMDEIDTSVEELVHQTPDTLHEETAAVFAGIIASGSVLATELLARSGNDKRLLDLIKEWRSLAQQGEELLDDITIPDPEPDDPDSKPEGEAKATEEGKPA